MEIWLPQGARNPHVGEIKEEYDISGITYLKFHGYFYYEDQTMPIERIFVRGRILYYVEILSKRTLEDTSKTFYDDDSEGYICLTPTAIIEITYRIIRTFDFDSGDEGLWECLKKIESQLEEENERDSNNRLENYYTKYPAARPQQ